MLTKTMGIVFFVLPLLYGIYIFIKTKTARKNSVYAFVSLLIVSAFFYVPNSQHIFGYLFYYGVGEGAKNYNVGASNLMSLKYWTIYFQHIIERGISPAYLVIFIASLISLLLLGKKKPTKDHVLIWLWFIVGYILLSIPLNKGGERYALPIMAPIAILISAHIARISFKPVKYGLVTFVIVVGLINYVYQTNSECCQYREVSYKGIPFLCSVQISCRMQNDVNASHDKQWEVMPLIRYMDEANKKREGVIRVLVGVDHHFLNLNTLRLYATLNRLKGSSVSDFQFDNVAYKPYDVQVIEQLLENSHFIITKSGYQGPTFSNVNNLLLKDLIKDRVPAKNFIIGDGSIISIYVGNQSF